jgi:ParB/RepB/Spo0J family partition protein
MSEIDPVAPARDAGAEALARLLHERDISQRALVRLAAEAGEKLHQPSIAQILKGTMGISRENARALAVTLGVSPILFMPELAGLVPETAAPALPAVKQGEVQAAEPAPGVPLIRLTPSPLNPRRDFTPAFRELLQDFVGFVLAGAHAAPLGDLVASFLAEAADRPGAAEALASPVLQSLAELADSIAEKGVLQNLLGRQDPDQAAIIWIIAGERRYWALELLRRTGRLSPELADHVPCRLLEVDDAEHIAIALLENLQRKDVNPIEEAQAFARLHALDPVKYDTAWIAQRIGMTRRHVQLRLALATKLSPETQTALADGRISLAQARALTKAPPDTQALVVKDIERGYLDDAEDVERSLQQTIIPASRAMFDLALYTGPQEINEATGEVMLQDPAAFMALQRSACETKAEELRKAGNAIVKLVTDNPHWSPVCWDAQREGIERSPRNPPPEAQSCAVIVLVDIGYEKRGSVEIFEGLIKKPKTAVTSAKVAAERGVELDPVDAVSGGRKIYALQAKSRALQTAMLQSPRLLLEALAAALIHGRGIMGIQPAHHRSPNVTVSAEIAQVFDRFRTRLDGKLGLGRKYATDATWLNGLLHAATYFDDADCAAVAVELEQLTACELQDLVHALLAARVITSQHIDPTLGDMADAVRAAERLRLDMSAIWRIDEDYLDTLKSEQLEELYYALKIPFDDLTPAAFGRMKVSEKRAALLAIVEERDLRHVPPEMGFGIKLSLEQSIRQAAKMRDTAPGAGDATADEADAYPDLDEENAA